MRGKLRAREQEFFRLWERIELQIDDLEMEVEGNRLYGAVCPV